MPVAGSIAVAGCHGTTVARRNGRLTPERCYQPAESAITRASRERSPTSSGFSRSAAVRSTCEASGVAEVPIHDPSVIPHLVSSCFQPVNDDGVILLYSGPVAISAQDLPSTTAPMWNFASSQRRRWPSA